MAKDAIESLDSQFNSIQHDKAINISSSSTEVPKDKQKITPMSGVLNQPEVDMDGLMTSMDKLKDKSEVDTLCNRGHCPQNCSQNQ